MRLAALLALGLALILLLLSFDLAVIFHWAVEQQRAFQNYMASAIRAIRSGDPWAYWALMGAAGAYGFVHAVGPGHGKYLIGGVGLGTSIRPARLLLISVASSLAQSLWAIILVYGCFSLLTATARQMTTLAEDILAPASYLAIAVVGLMLVWRGIRSLPEAPSHHHDHDHGHATSSCGCSHAHGPTPEEAAKVTSIRDAAVLIASIAIRPCTGAIFLLVIAWQMDIAAAGAGAVLVMGLGTAALTSLVALSSVSARGLAWLSAKNTGLATLAIPVLQMLIGTLVAMTSLAFAGFRLF